MTPARSSPDDVSPPARCPRCSAAPSVGVLCTGCAALVSPAEGLIPGHISSKVAPDDATAWLVDGFGAPHPVGGGRTVIGRRTDAELVILAVSVSRDHAELRRVEGGWELRDLGSRNHTHIDGRRLDGRAPLAGGAIVRFGEVGFAFVDAPLAPVPDPRSIATGHARSQGGRYLVRGPAIELCLVAADGGAVLLHRADGLAWQELALAPLELELLRVLAARAVEEAGSPARTRGCVSSRQLATVLPFASDHANEENVRKLVQRTRAGLAEIDAAELVENVQGRGYYLAWPVALS